MTPRSAALAGALVALTGASSARAQLSDYELARAARAETNWAFEVRFGPYRPDVDSAFTGGVKPYQKVFGDSTRWLVGGEVDWNPIHVPHLGSLGFGGLFGYTSASANAQFSDGSGSSAEDTKFSLWMLAALGVLRVDVLARETWLPIVPYAKLGPAVGLWSTENGTGTSSVDGVRGEGKTFGLLYAAGVMLQLDFLDRQAAKTFDAEQGVRHSYVLGEYTVASMSSLGQSGAMRVGDTTWTLGLAMQF